MEASIERRLYLALEESTLRHKCRVVDIHSLEIALGIMLTGPGSISLDSAFEKLMVRA
jgi:hypothetical protein